MKEVRELKNGASLKDLCSVFGHSRQAYYEWGNREQEAALEQAIIIDLVPIFGKKSHESVLERCTICYISSGKNKGLNVDEIGLMKSFGKLKC